MTAGAALEIRLDDLSGSEIRALLAEHLRQMHELSPPGSVHALDVSALRSPAVRFWTAWSAGELAGCAALRELDRTHGEIKSMRTAAAHRRRGVARRLLQHILTEAHARGYRRLSLETGSAPAFGPARALYEGFGFAPCAPFEPYREDAHSVFLTRRLS